MSNNLKLAISGKSGCGNTTVSKILAQSLGLRFINYTFHNLAQELHISFEHLCLIAEKDTQYDYYVDKKQLQLASHGNCIIGSRLAIWLLKDADLRVYLDASLPARAQRLANREKEEYKVALQKTRLRDGRDRKRYERLYQIDVDNYDFADLIVDTEKGDQKYVVHTIFDYMTQRKFISPDPEWKIL